MAAYGSHKDIVVYQSLNIKADRIFAVGKVPKKAHSQAQVGHIAFSSCLQLTIFTNRWWLCAAKLRFMIPCPFQILTDGYAAHLQHLTLSNKISPSTCNARLFLQKSSFTLPGQKTKAKKLLHNQAKRVSVDSKSAISVNNNGNTSIDAGVEGGYSNSSKVRGRAPNAPRLVILQRIPDDGGDSGGIEATTQANSEARKSLSS